MHMKANSHNKTFFMTPSQDNNYVFSYDDCGFENLQNGCRRFQKTPTSPWLLTKSSTGQWMRSPPAEVGAERHRFKHDYQSFPQPQHRLVDLRAIISPPFSLRSRKASSRFLSSTIDAPLIRSQAERSSILLKRSSPFKL